MRTLDADTLAALEAGRYAVRELILFDLPSGRWGTFNDHFDLTWGGDTYRGAAGSFKLQVPPGAADLSVRGLTATFSGLDSEALTWFQAQNYAQRPMFAALAIIATDTPQVVAVKKWFSGSIDTAVWTERPNGEGRIVVKCESGSRDLDRSGARTRSDADQRSLDPNDKFFEHTVGAIATEISWGTATPAQVGGKKKWWQKLF